MSTNCDQNRDSGFASPERFNWFIKSHWPDYQNGKIKCFHEIKPYFWVMTSLTPISTLLFTPCLLFVLIYIYIYWSLIRYEKQAVTQGNIHALHLDLVLCFSLSWLFSLSALLWVLYSYKRHMSWTDCLVVTPLVGTLHILYSSGHTNTSRHNPQTSNFISLSGYSFHYLFSHAGFYGHDFWFILGH